MYCVPGCGWRKKAKERGERNNGGKLEPEYSAQFSATAPTRHEQEKSIRPTWLLSEGLPPWERVEQIKALEEKKKREKKVAEEEAEVLVWYILCQINCL